MTGLLDVAGAGLRMTPHVLQVEMGPHLPKWLEGSFLDAILSPFMPYMILIVLLAGLWVLGGLAIYTRGLAIPTVVAITFLGAFAAFLPGIVARAGLLLVIGVMTVLLLLAVLVLSR